MKLLASVEPPDEPQNTREDKKATTEGPIQLFVIVGLPRPTKKIHRSEYPVNSIPICHQGTFVSS